MRWLITKWNLFNNMLCNKNAKWNKFCLQNAITFLCWKPFLKCINWLDEWSHFHFVWLLTVKMGDIVTFWNFTSSFYLSFFSHSSILLCLHFRNEAFTDHSIFSWLLALLISQDNNSTLHIVPVICLLFILWSQFSRVLHSRISVL